MVSMGIQPPPLLKDCLAHAAGFAGMAAVLELASSLKNASVKILRLGYPDVFMPHGSNKELLKELGLDADGIARSIKNFLSA